MFDEDDTLVYEPEFTAAVVLTGGDEESEKEALQVQCNSVRLNHTCLCSMSVWSSPEQQYGSDSRDRYNAGIVVGWVASQTSMAPLHGD